MGSTSLATVDPVVAAFDVDGTLTVRDCVLPFLVRSGRAGFVVRVLKHLPRVLRLAAARDRDGLKAVFVASAVSGMSVDALDAIGTRFASVVAGSWMRSDVAARLRWHQDQGHVVVLVSASLAPYLVPLGELLEVDAVLCTELESENGFLTGELLGSNCRGQEKLNRLHSWAVESGIVGEEWLQYAYGDSSGDTEMLAAARQGVNVHRMEVTPCW